MSQRTSISEHAIDRWIERVRPGSDRRQAVRDILAMLPLAEEISAPEWMLGECDQGDRYFSIAGAVLVIASSNTVVTVMTRWVAGGAYTPRKIAKLERARERAKERRAPAKPGRPQRRRLDDYQR